jgi:hypothetical protein
MTGHTATELRALKSDSFGRISLMQGPGGMFVRRDLAHVPWWLRLPAWWLARREALALQRVDGMAELPFHRLDISCRLDTSESKDVVASGIWKKVAWARSMRPQTKRQKANWWLARKRELRRKCSAMVATSTAAAMHVSALDWEGSLMAVERCQPAGG